MAENALVFKVPAAASVPMLAAGPPAAGQEEEKHPARDAACAYELAHPHESTVWRATGNEEPVFLDRTGRRRPLLRFAGVGAGLMAAGWLAALVTGAIGFSDLPGTAAVTPPAVRAAVADHPARLVAATTVRAHRRLAIDTDRPRRPNRASGPRPIRV